MEKNMMPRRRDGQLMSSECEWIGLFNVTSLQPASYERQTGRRAKRRRMKVPQTWIHWVSNPGLSGLKSSVLSLDQAHRSLCPTSLQNMAFCCVFELWDDLKDSLWPTPMALAQIKASIHTACALLYVQFLLRYYSIPKDWIKCPKSLKHLRYVD